MLEETPTPAAAATGAVDWRRSNRSNADGRSSEHRRRWRSIDGRRSHNRLEAGAGNTGGGASTAGGASTGGPGASNSPEELHSGGAATGGATADVC